MTTVKLGLMATVTVLALTGIATSGDKPTPTMADVKKAWKARQDEAKAFRVDWVTTVKVKAGYYASEDSPNNPGPHPPEDTELTCVCSFASDGEKATGATEEAIYVPREKTFRPYAQMIRFDGKDSISIRPLYLPGWARVNITTGNDPLNPYGTAGGLRSTTNHPVTAVYRPLDDRVFAIDWDQFKLSGREEKIRGTPCVEIVAKNPSTDPEVVYSLWCDADRGFVPVREKQRYPGGGRNLDWEYRKDDAGRWVPSGWTEIRLGKDGKAISTRKTGVKKVEFGAKFPATAFEIKPPPSSSVTLSKDGLVEDNYLIRPDGSKRSLVDADRGKAFEEVIKTNADGTPYVPAKK